MGWFTSNDLYFELGTSNLSYLTERQGLRISNQNSKAFYAHCVPILSCLINSKHKSKKVQEKKTLEMPKSLLKVAHECCIILTCIICIHLYNLCMKSCGAYYSGRYNISGTACLYILKKIKHEIYKMCRTSQMDTLSNTV